MSEKSDDLDFGDFAHIDFEEMREHCRLAVRYKDDEWDGAIVCVVDGVEYRSCSGCPFDAK